MVDAEPRTVSREMLPLPSALPLSWPTLLETKASHGRAAGNRVGGAANGRTASAAKAKLAEASSAAPATTNRFKVDMVINSPVGRQASQRAARTIIRSVPAPV